jgi:hypothetical protein
MKKKYTIYLVIVGLLGMTSCAARVPLNEAPKYGLNRIDRLTLNSGRTIIYHPEQIDTTRMLVIGKSSVGTFQYKFDEIKYFESTKPGLTILAVAGGILALAAIIFAATFDMSFDFNIPRMGSMTSH